MKRRRFRCRMKYYFNITFIQVQLKKIELALLKDQRDLIKVLAQFPGGLEKLAASRGILDPRTPSSARKRHVPPTPPWKCPHHRSERPCLSHVWSRRGKSFRSAKRTAGRREPSLGFSHLAHVVGRPRLCGCPASTWGTSLKFKGDIQARDLAAAKPENLSDSRVSR